METDTSTVYDDQRVNRPGTCGFRAIDIVLLSSDPIKTFPCQDYKKSYC